MIKLFFNVTVRAFFLSLITMTVFADGAVVTVPMNVKASGTYYLKAGFSENINNELMLDTGSEYVVINERTLKSLLAKSQAEYVENITGVLANGAELKIPVYRLASITIGGCVIRDTTAAVFPGNTREILGLTALRKVAPFAVSLDPAVLTLNNCGVDTASQHAVDTPSHSVGADDLSRHSEIASMQEN